MNKDNTKFLSVVVPAYKQEATIYENLIRIKEVLDSTKYQYEIICVVDGRCDNTWEKANRAADGKIKVVGYEINQGKGHAVRFGMAQAKGDTIAFIDAGLELNPETIIMGLEHMKWYGADVIVGSKRHPASIVNYPSSRRAMSLGYQTLTRLLFGLNVKDTQLGMKLFRREVLDKTLPKLLVKRYAFDIEMLAVANHLGFKKIYESPVQITYHFKDLTHASTMRSIGLMLWDTLAVFYRLRILHYYDRTKK